MLYTLQNVQVATDSYKLQLMLYAILSVHTFPRRAKELAACIPFVFSSLIFSLAHCLVSRYASLTAFEKRVYQDLYGPIMPHNWIDYAIYQVGDLSSSALPCVISTILSIFYLSLLADSIVSNLLAILIQQLIVSWSFYRVIDIYSSSEQLC